MAAIVSALIIGALLRLRLAVSEMIDPARGSVF